MKTLTTTNKTGGICYCSVARTPLRGLLLLLDRSVLWGNYTATVNLSCMNMCVLYSLVMCVVYVQTFLFCCNVVYTYNLKCPPHSCCTDAVIIIYCIYCKSMYVYCLSVREQ